MGFRTRSKGPLPDGEFPGFQDSPLKVARRALTAAPTACDDSESEDELLLSPNKNNNLETNQHKLDQLNENSKRSASPVSSDLEHKDLKRAKLSHINERPPPSLRWAHGHSRASSEPNARIPSSVSLEDIEFRSRSVPRFLDLANPPASPRKKMTSPDKQQQLQILPRPSSLDRSLSPSNTFPPENPVEQMGTALPSMPAVSEPPAMGPPPPPPPKAGLSIIPEVPSTPTQPTNSIPAFTMSPLTPLGPTPLPRASTQPPKQYKKPIGRLNLDPSSNATANTGISGPSSKIPRPTAPKLASTKGSLAKSLTCSSHIPSAFERLMDNARANTGKGPASKSKGKGKAISGLSIPDTGRSKQPSIAESFAKPMMLTKGKMKPREKSKLATRMIVDEEEDDRDASPPSPTSFTLLPLPAAQGFGPSSSTPAIATSSVNEDHNMNVQPMDIAADGSSSTEPDRARHSDADYPMTDAYVTEQSKPREALATELASNTVTELVDVPMKEPPRNRPSNTEERLPEASTSSSAESTHNGETLYTDNSLSTMSITTKDVDLSVGNAGYPTSNSKLDAYEGLSRGGPQVKVPTAVELRRSSRTSSKRKAETETQAPVTPPKRAHSQSKRVINPLPPAGNSTTDGERASTPPLRNASPKTPTKSPTKSSFARPTASSMAKSTPKSPVKLKSTPSPTKRSLSMNARPTGTFIRSFPMSSGRNSSSLSDLTSALDKLKRPAPSRPNSSLGFVTQADAQSLSSSLMSDAPLPGPSRKPGVQRAATIGPDEFTTSSSAAQKPSSMDHSGKTQQKSIFPPTSGAVMRGRPGGASMGVRGRLTQKISRLPGLATVIGSPVKGGAADAGTKGPDSPLSPLTDEERLPTPPITHPMATTETTMDVSHSTTPQDLTTPEQPESLSATRRASHAFQTISQLANSAAAGTKEPPKKKSTMGPPATPPRRSSRQVARSASYSNPEAESSVAGPSDGSRTAPAACKEPSKQAKDSGPRLTILKDCIIFVDVKGEDGREAGELFSDMLRSLGAKLLNSVGSTCTHIVYKDGLPSTISRYQMAHPKPFMVGISWVVECAEKQIKADEAKHVVDVESLALLTTGGRRRKSNVPTISGNYPMSTALAPSLHFDSESEDGNESVDTSTSFDDLTPLERARLRRLKSVNPS